MRQRRQPVAGARRGAAARARDATGARSIAAHALRTNGARGRRPRGCRCRAGHRTGAAPRSRADHRPDGCGNATAGRPRRDPRPARAPGRPRRHRPHRAHRVHRACAARDARHAEHRAQGRSGGRRASAEPRATGARRRTDRGLTRAACFVRDRLQRLPARAGDRSRLRPERAGRRLGGVRRGAARQRPGRGLSPRMAEPRGRGSGDCRRGTGIGGSAGSVVASRVDLSGRRGAAPRYCPRRFAGGRNARLPERRLARILRRPAPTHRAGPRLPGERRRGR